MAMPPRSRFCCGPAPPWTWWTREVREAQELEEGERKSGFFLGGGGKEDVEEEFLENFGLDVIRCCFVQFLDVVGCYQFVLDTSVRPSS